jgi:1,4-dihydroxy-2-naphthoate octaprenyltransferase
MVSGAPRPSRARAWLLGARPATLSAAITPVLVGTGAAAAGGYWRPLIFAATLLASILIQIGTNLANDYFDYRKGADTAERLGPPRVTQSGLLTASTVRNGALLSFGLAGLLGVYLAFAGGWWIVIIGLACILAGALYTGGPWPLGYHGLGDLTCFLFFGIVAVLGTFYLQAGTVTPSVLAASVPVACLVTVILAINNLRDIDTDRKTGKRTLAVLVGRRGTRIEIVSLLAVAYLVPLLFWVAGRTAPWSLLPWLTLPLAIPLARLVLCAEGRPLNAGLRASSRLHLFFGALWAVGLLLR